MNLRIIIVAVGLLVAVPSAQAQEDGENHWFHRSDLGIRINPIGASMFSDTGFRLNRGGGDDPLYKGARFELGAATGVSPAYVWAGPFIEAIPFAFLKVRASFQPLYYFGTFGAIAEFDGPEADWSPERLDQVEEEDLGEATAGWRFNTVIRFQLKAGPIVAFVESDYAWMSMNVSSEYYEPFYDLLLSPEDEVWTVSAAGGYVFGGELDDGFLLLGARWQEQTTRNTDLARQTATLLWIWDIPDSFWSWGTPRLVGIVGAYLEDEYHEGEPLFAMKLSISLPN